MTELFQFIENNPVILWVVGSPSIFAYPTVLALHTVGMAFLVGTTAGLSLRTLGFASGLPLAPLDKFFPVAFVGFWMATLSGMVLLAAEASRFLTTGAFYIKLAGIVGAVISVRLLRKTVFQPPSDSVTPKGKLLAGATLTFWLVAILAGRATAYWSVTGWKTAGAFVVLVLVLSAAGYAGVRVWSRASSAGESGALPSPSAK